MPSLFITKVNSGAAIPTFAKKGIPDQMPGVVGDIPVQVESVIPRVGVPYLKHLILAIHHYVCVAVTGILYTNLFKTMISLPQIFDVPVCTFRFANLTPSQVEQLKSIGLQQDLVNTNLFVGTPAATIAQMMAKLDKAFSAF
jgi:hypothetical protein